MKNLLVFLTVGLLTILMSCKNSGSSIEEGNSIEAGVTTIDSTSIPIELINDEVSVDSIISIDVNALLAKVKSDTVYHVSFVLDSNYISNIEDLEQATLTNEEVQYLSVNLVDNEITSWTTHDIKTFLEIDSMKLTGKYDEYVRNLDIGMMQESDATVQHKVIINNDSFILLWTLSYSTYEACPYASGAIFFGTFFKNNMALNTATLGQDSSGGDAPYWGSTFITSQINSTLIITNKHEESGGEMDEETGEDIIEISDKEFKVNLTEQGFKVVK